MPPSARKQKTPGSPGPPRPPPTANVPFPLFGPNIHPCTAPPALPSSPPRRSSDLPPTATSDPFTPTAPGTYRWIAAYSGDANYAAATTACNDANETSVIAQATPTIVTSATPTATLGQPKTGSAHVSTPATQCPPTPTPACNNY